LAVKINGNCGAQQQISVSTKVSKEIVPFPQEEVWCKNYWSGQLESDKKIRIRLLLVLLGIRPWLHPKTSDSLRLQPRNPGCETHIHLLRMVLHSFIRHNTTDSFSFFYCT